MPELPNGQMQYWAPPLMWGPTRPLDLGTFSDDQNTSRTVVIKVNSRSNAPGPVECKVLHVNSKGEHTASHFLGPGAKEIALGPGAAEIDIACKAAGQGQILRIRVDET